MRTKQDEIEYLLTNNGYEKIAEQDDDNGKIEVFVKDKTSLSFQHGHKYVGIMALKEIGEGKSPLNFRKEFFAGSKGIDFCYKKAKMFLKIFFENEVYFDELEKENKDETQDEPQEL